MSKLIVNQLQPYSGSLITFVDSTNVSVGGTLAVTGAATLSSTLGVTGATTLSSTLGVTGAATLSSTLAVTGVSTLTGNVGIGTAPSYPLHVAGINSTAANDTITGSSANLYAIAVRQKGASAGIGGANYMSQIISTLGSLGLEIYTPDNKELIFGTDATERAKIAPNGDISFRDSSANEAFYWDASAASLGIGTSNPEEVLHIIESNSPTLRIESGDTSGTVGEVIGKVDFWGNDFSGTGRDSRGYIASVYEDSFARAALVFASGTYNETSSERMRIDSSGNVGIGISPVSTSSGRRTLHVNYSGADGSLGAELRLTNSAINGSAAGDGAVLLYAGSDLYLSNKESGNVLFSTNGSERMRIDSSGRVGIGLSPTAMLHIGGTSRKLYSNNETTNYAYMQFENTGGNFSLGVDRNTGGGLMNGSAGYATIFGTNNATALCFGTNLDERMRITSNGTVLIGTTTQEGIGGVTIYPSNSAGAPTYITNRTSSASSSTIFQFQNGGSPVGSITHTSTATAYNTSSDYRLKEDWVAMEGALDRVDALKPINFAWKADGSRVDGFLAHELAEVVPEAVHGEKDAVKLQQVEVSPAVLDEEGNVITEAVYEEQEVPVYQGIDQSKIVPLLVAAIQELKAKVESLEAQLNA